jgi:hypothetical protein
MIGVVRINKQEIEKAICAMKNLKYLLIDVLGNKNNEKEFDVAIEMLEKQLTNGWIPVSERLPKEDGNYLVTMKHKEFNQTKVTSMDFNGEFLFNDYFEKAWWEVIAWQNLPDPYKEVSE